MHEIVTTITRHDTTRQDFIHAPYSPQTKTLATQRVAAVPVDGRILVLAQTLRVLTITFQNTPIVQLHPCHPVDVGGPRSVAPGPNDVHRTHVAARFLRTHQQPWVGTAVPLDSFRNVLHVPVKIIPVRTPRLTQRFPRRRWRVRVRGSLILCHPTTPLTTRRTVQLMVRHSYVWCTGTYTLHGP